MPNTATRLTGEHARAEHFLALVFDRVPLQQKKVRAFFEHTPEAHEDLAQFLHMYRTVWDETGGLDALADAYARVVNEVMMCRKDFMRSGTYALSSQVEAGERVYHNAEQMVPYMMGLGVSQYLWQSHYRIFDFFKQCVASQPRNGRFLEVGSGHGIFTNIMADYVADDAVIDVVDISAVSIALSKQLLAAANPHKAPRIRFTESDIANYASAQRYDFIVMGEVLEHVEAPHSILHALKRLCADQGRIYITTCANCPAIDHVYHFHNVEEIRRMIADVGLNIAEEIVVPSEEGKSLEYHEKFKLDILYGAMLTR